MAALCDGSWRNIATIFAWRPGVREATGAAEIPLGLDAVSGAATARIAACLRDEGTICTYGSMTGEAPAVSVADVVFRGMTFTGFMLGRFMAGRSAEEIRTIYAELGGEMLKGAIHAPVDSVYPIEDIREALIRAQTGGRQGKVLVSPGGDRMSDVDTI